MLPLNIRFFIVNELADAIFSLFSKVRFFFEKNDKIYIYIFICMFVINMGARKG